MTKTRPLGKTQIAILSSLHEHKGWSAGCGWIWDTHSNTVRLLESLIARGLVTKTTRAYRTPYGYDSTYTRYEPVKPEVREV